MSRRFKQADYAATLEMTVRLGDCLPPEHLARFVVEAIAQMDLSAIYARYGTRGGEAYAPEILVGLLFYGYATGVFSTRKIERATYESLPFRYIAGDLHPDHDTIASFRKAFLTEIKELFVQLLVLAHLAEVLVLGAVSGDGAKIHTDASNSKAVSYKRLGEIDTQLRAEVEELFALSEQAEQQDLPAGLVVGEEIARREAYLARLAEAKAILEARAAEQMEYEAKMAQRAEKERTSGRRPGGRPPSPPTPGPRDNDQYNFTDPESRIMKNPTDAGFEQDYNVQLAVDQQSLLIVSSTLSNHPNDAQEAEALLAALPSRLGTPPAAAWDAGYFSPATFDACARRGIEPYIATGRDPHHPTWQDRFAPLPTAPPADASPQGQMAYKLKTALGRAIYGARKCTVEPVIGIIKEVLGFRQFSLRGVEAAAGEWCLVCLAFNLKRLHTLLAGDLRRLTGASDLQRPVEAPTPLSAAITRRCSVLIGLLRSAFAVRACSHRPPLLVFSPTGC